MRKIKLIIKSNSAEIQPNNNTGIKLNIYNLQEIIFDRNYYKQEIQTILNCLDIREIINQIGKEEIIKYLKE
jgi:hypothetical protein